MRDKTPATIAVELKAAGWPFALAYLFIFQRAPRLT